MSRSHRWPLELGPLPAERGEPPGDEEGRIVASAVVSEELDDGGLRLSIQLPDAAGPLVIDDRQAGPALPALRAALEDAGWLLYCNAFRRDALFSAMASGLTCYLTPPGRHVRPGDLVESLGPAPRELVVTATVAARAAAERARPLRRATAEVVDLVDRIRAGATGETAGRSRLDDEIWLEPTGRSTEPEVGVVYQVELIGGKAAFLAVLAPPGQGTADEAAGGVAVGLFCFVGASTAVEPATLFLDENLTAERFVIDRALWREGHARALGPGRTSTAPSIADDPPMSVAAFSRAVYAELGVVPGEPDGHPR